MGRDVARLGGPGLEEDPEMRGNAVFARYRRVSLGLLCQAFEGGDRVLDLGCGTGLEAACLALWGVSVLGVDPVADRVAAAEERARTLGVEDLVEVRVLGRGGLPALADELGEGCLDGAYSSFGPLNCEPDLGAVAAALGALVRPGGRLVVSVMNRVCAWEVAIMLARGRPREAFRRFHVARGRTGGAEVEVRYYDLQELTGAFSPWFAVEEARGLAKLPPPFADGLARHFPRFLDWAADFDPGFLKGLGDHLFVTMGRR